MPTKPPPSPQLVKMVGKLFDIATNSAKKPLSMKTMKSVDKLYELKVLAQLLQTYKNSGGKVNHVPPTSKPKKSKNAAAAPMIPPWTPPSPSNVLVVAGSPSYANRTMYSHFDMRDSAGELEAWISVQVQTLSWDRLKQIPIPAAAKHEMDVGVFIKGVPSRPTHNDLYLGISCKNVSKIQKLCVREALGMRRETALWGISLSYSRVPWLIQSVPTRPASPILLCSSDPGIKKFAIPVDEHGVYIRYSAFPR